MYAHTHTQTHTLTMSKYTDDAECVLEAEESERCGTCTPLLPAVIERATSSRAIDQPRIPEIVQRSQGTEVREVGGDEMRSRRRVWEEEKGGENVEKDICEAGGKDICQAEETVVKDLCQARGSVVRERNEIKDKNAVLQELLARCVSVFRICLCHTLTHLYAAVTASPLLPPSVSALSLSLLLCTCLLHHCIYELIQHV